MQLHEVHGHSEPDIIVAGPSVTYSTILIKVFVVLEHAVAVGARWTIKTDDDAYINIPQAVQVRTRVSHVCRCRCAAICWSVHHEHHGFLLTACRCEQSSHMYCICSVAAAWTDGRAVRAESADAVHDASVRL